MEIKGKKIIITGGAKGIGKCLVEKLLDKGAYIGIFDIDDNALNEANNSFPECFIRRCDITDPEQVNIALTDFVAQHGQIDVLINVAGFVKDSPLISISGEIKKHDLALWNKIIAVNLTSVFIVSSHVAEHMIKKRTKGLIVNVSSVSANGNAGQSAYSAAKCGVIALTKTWAKELNAFGIRVAGISPGFTKTEMILSIMNEKILNEWNKKIPLRRMAQPSEIADGIIFIINNEYFNGKILELDGGLVL